MIARPTRTVSVGINPTNIRATPSASNPRLSYPVTFATLRYASGGGTIELVAESQLAYATGTLTAATNPLDTETIAVNGVTFTFVAGASTATNVNIKASKELTMVEFAVVLNASANGSITVATYTVVGAILTVTYDTYGTGGDAFTLANSSGSVAITRSAATLAGGEPDFGDGQTVAADGDFNDADQSLVRYAIASTGTVSLDVTDYEA